MALSVGSSRHIQVKFSEMRLDYLTVFAKALTDLNLRFVTVSGINAQFSGAFASGSSF